MTLQIKLFAVAMQKAGSAVLEVECPLPATVDDVRQAVLATCPALAEVIPHCRFALNDEFAQDNAPVDADSVVAIIPPVSGGAS